MAIEFYKNEAGHILADKNGEPFARAYFQDFRSGWVIDFQNALDSFSDVKTENVELVIRTKAENGFWFPLQTRFVAGSESEAA